MAKTVLVTEPAIEPVSLYELREHVRLIDQNQERDTQLTDYEVAARVHVEQVKTWRALVNTTYDQYFDTFRSRMPLDWPPTGSITSVKYTDINGDEQTVDSSVYELGECSGVGVLRLQYNQEWPSDVRGHPDDIVVRLVAGYGATAASVPAPIRAAIKIMVADMYENPESFVTGTIIAQFRHEATVDRLLSPYRITRSA